MAHFVNYGDKINKIIEMLLANQDLCKLLYYNDYNPLDQANISDTRVLLLDKIYPMPKYPDAEIEKTSRLCVYMSNIRPFGNNDGFVEPKLCFEVICHQDVWLVDSNLRPFLIMNNIDEMFNNAFIPTLSTRESRLYLADIKLYADYYSGYILMYNLTESSYLGCAT